MLIDWHTHIHDPKDQANPFWQGRCPMTLEHVLAAHELAGLDRTVISNAGHHLRFCKTAAEIVALIETSNRYLAKCRDQHPDKLVAMATAVPGGGDEVLKELERAVREDDARAVIITASHQGRYPDEDAAKPFFKLVTDLDIPVFLHPGDFDDARLQRIPACFEHQPAGRQLSVAGTADRARHLRAVSDAQAGRQPSWRRHLRGDRPYGLCL